MRDGEREAGGGGGGRRSGHGTRPASGAGRMPWKRVALTLGDERGKGCFWSRVCGSIDARFVPYPLEDEVIALHEVIGPGEDAEAAGEARDLAP